MKKLIVLACLLLSLSASARDPAQVRAFKRSHACPSTGVTANKPCPGYAVDHIVPLACGGPDKPSNMQWQTVADAKTKDKVERKAPGCKK